MHHCQRIAWRIGLLILAAALATEARLQAQPSAPAKEGDTATRLINHRLAAGWKANDLKPADRTTDAQFIRRVSFDILGLIPTAQEVRDFEIDNRPGKRAALVDRLLADDGCAVHWAYVWADWLLPDGYHPTYRGQLRKALERQLSKKRSHQDFVRTLLTASGQGTEDGAVHFILAHTGAPLAPERRAEDGQYDMKPITVETVRLFLGYRFECIQCHDHPFEAARGQPHFYGLNAFFRQTERNGSPCTGRTATPVVLQDNAALNRDGKVRYERRNGQVKRIGPTWLDGKPVMEKLGQTRRAALATLVINHANFAPAYVNRLWGYFFGRGMLQQPVVDDFGDGNPPVDPELLDGLGRAFVAANYDPKKLMAWICTSDAYQLQSTPNATNGTTEADPYFSRMLKKRVEIDE